MPKNIGYFYPGEIFGMWLFFVLSCILLILVAARAILMLIFKFRNFISEKENLLEIPLMVVILSALISSMYNIVWATHIGALSVLFIWIKVTWFKH